MQRLKEAGDVAGYAALDADFPYMAVDTCAVDGLCATACPMGIDTSKLTKYFRKLRHTEQEHKRAVSLARNFATTEKVARLGLALGHLGASLFGHTTMTSLTRGMRAMTGQVLPLWSKEMPRARKGALPVTTAAGAAAVYFPTCVSRVMGALPGEPDDRTLMDALLNVAERAGVKLYVPADAVGVCCGVPFSSKGFEPAHHEAINHAIERIWTWTGEGAIPVVVDTSPCSYGLQTARPHLTAENQARFDKLRIIDSIEFANDRLLPRLTVVRKVHSVVLHPVCSVTKMGLTNKLVKRCRGLQRPCNRAAERRLLRLCRRPRLPVSGIDRGRDQARGRRGHGRQLRRTLFKQPHLRSRHDARDRQDLSLFRPSARLCHQAVSFAQDGKARPPWRAFFIAPWVGRSSPGNSAAVACFVFRLGIIQPSSPEFARCPWQSSAIDILRRRRAATWGLARWSRTSRGSACSIAMDRST